MKFSLLEKCPYSEFSWSIFFRIRTEYGEIRSISPYLVRMRENTDRRNSEYGHFLRSVSIKDFLCKYVQIRRKRLLKKYIMKDFICYAASSSRLCCIICLERGGENCEILIILFESFQQSLLILF